MTAHNTFDKPETIKPAEFKDAKITDDGLATVLPPKSVVMLEIR
jgi:alpha-N-arabinofuranosidase